MLSVGIVLSGKKVSLNVSEKTTVRELIKMYKNLNPYKKISLKTRNFNGVKIDKNCSVKDVVYGRIYRESQIEIDKDNGDYLLFAEIENPEKNDKCTMM